MINPLKQLNDLGQSVWLDYLSRELLVDGELRRLIEEDGVTGVTSNPAIFEHAINHGAVYNLEIERLVRQGQDEENVYRRLTLNDVAAASDLLLPVYEATGGADGFVSLEVSPHLARDSEATLEEARELWRSLSRRNILIKVPGTEEGIPVVRQLIADGINVNVTLLFSLERYRAAREAWLEGLEERQKAGLDLKVSSVASFFLSRIDTIIDPLLTDVGANAELLCGQVAIAAAKVAYADYLRASAEPRFGALIDAGALPQRLLWASTSAKNPAYSDCHYIDPLVGSETVTTLPLQTLNAYRQHGKPGRSLEEGLERAYGLIGMLPAYGIDLDAIATQLEQEGLRKFIEPHDKLLESLASRRSQILCKGTGERGTDFQGTRNK